MNILTIASKEIYDELKEIIDDGINEFADESEQTFSKLINHFNNASTVKLIPPYTEFIEKMCNEAYLHTLDTFSKVLSDVCNNIAEQLDINYSYCTENFIEFEKQLSEIQEKLNSN